MWNRVLRVWGRHVFDKLHGLLRGSETSKMPARILLDHSPRTPTSRGRHRYFRRRLFGQIPQPHHPIPTAEY